MTQSNTVIPDSRPDRAGRSPSQGDDRTESAGYGYGDVQTWLVAGAILLVLVLGVWLVLNHRRPGAAPAFAAPAAAEPTVEVSDLQLKQIKVEAIASREFTDQRGAVGYIDFNQDRTTQVYAQYPGRITTLNAKLGDDVGAGAILFYVDSPDLAAAESALIGAAATRELTRRALERAKGLYQLEGYAQKDYEQAVSDAADGRGRLPGSARCGANLRQDRRRDRPHRRRPKG